jgi:hypothetical protein
VSKADLLKQLELLRQKLERMPATRQHSHLVAMSLLVAAENALQAGY